MHTFFSSWFFQDLVVALLIVLLTLLAVRLAKREYWKKAFQAICQRRTARISFAILSLYTGIALLDSIGWNTPLRDPVTQKIVRNPKTQEILYGKGGSLLDHILAPLINRQEKTYSAPLANQLYTYETVLNSDGTTQRVHPKLRFSRQHLLGTDRIGIDVLYQACKSIRTGIIIGLFTTLLAIPFALFAGISAGYFGGRIDDLIQYIYTVLSSIPTILFIAAFMIIFGNGLFQLCFAMGIASWTSLCRLLRGETLKLRESEFIQASHALGQSDLRIILRHILPNVLHLVLITAVLRFSSEVLAEAALTYLGIGVSADTTSWGTMINDARTELTRNPVIWWKLVTAFVFMLGLVLPANLFGDAVRDALDPRLRE
ncbi:MAG: ABC transporter permease [Lentisphaeria bacterium]